MTDKPAAFSANYCGWRMRGKEIVISFSLPREAADHAYRVLNGMPNPEESTWFAIARMETKHGTDD